MTAAQQAIKGYLHSLLPGGEAGSHHFTTNDGRTTTGLLVRAVTGPHGAAQWLVIARANRPHATVNLDLVTTIEPVED